MNPLAKPDALCLLFPRFLPLLVGWAPQGEGSARELGPEVRAGSGSGVVVLSQGAALLGAPLSGVLLNLLLVHSFNKRLLGTYCVARSCSRHVE